MTRTDYKILNNMVYKPTKKMTVMGMMGYKENEEYDEED